jgi:hypothetical protein
VKIARLFFRKRWLIQGNRFFGFATCHRSDRMPSGRRRTRQLPVNRFFTQEIPVAWSKRCANS